MAIIAKKNKIEKLDAIDKKIFYFLSVNYRIQRKKLAKLIKISPQRLNHRINQLERIFLEPYVALNYPKLNIRSYLLFYNSLTNIEIASITKSENAYYLLHLVGESKFLAIIITEDILEFCSKHTPRKTPKISQITGYFPDKWNGFQIQPIKETIKKENKYKLSKKDYKVLSLLCDNPNISFLEISQKLNISRQTVSNRIKIMEDSKIIQNYKFSVNLPKANLLTYFIHLECKPIEIKKNINLIKFNPYSGFLYQSHNNLFFSYVVFEHKQLYEFLEIIEKETNSIIKVSQNTGDYLVNPVPKYIRDLLKKRSQ